MSQHATLLAKLLPPVAYSPNDPSLTVELAAEGKALDQAMADARVVELGIVPSFDAIQFLPDWERVFGLVPKADDTLQQRMSMVMFMANATGGLSIPYFIGLAKVLGYTITIDEFEPFRVDRNRVGDPLFSEDAMWLWRVNVEGAPELKYYFRVGKSAVGERLAVRSDPILETLFEDLKPAHTKVIFQYDEDNDAEN
ncbi:phage tail protein [Pandoraea anapnoica]|uniref:Phage tail protein n=1 Tax=Pandoraea anapnoica TaxID=2508301 RepID=A0A5E5AST4_9BURK|nr:putative phage tail protein [Pandoraea anapnoica]VVE76358.1 phage tail protein [Pandoraea anapnoica]